MSVSFPTSLDTFTNPAGTAQVSVVTKHSTHHANHNDAIEALEAKVGADSSGVTTSHDYKLSPTTGTAKVLATNGDQDVEGVKTFLSPGGVKGTAFVLADPKIFNSVRDANNNKIFETPATVNAVNYFIPRNSVAGTAISYEAAGSDTNIDMLILPKGTGQIILGTARVKFPNSKGTSGQVLQSDGAGNTAWASQTTLTASSVVIPYPVATSSGNLDTEAISTNTTLRVSAFYVNAAIVVNKISINVSAVGASGTLKIVVFDQDGTLVGQVTTATISGTGIVTTTISPAITLGVGIYYIGILPVSTANITVYAWNPVATARLDNISGEPVLCGTLTVTADTIPSSIDITALTATDGTNAFGFRFDN